MERDFNLPIDDISSASGLARFEWFSLLGENAQSFRFFSFVSMLLSIIMY